MVLASDQKMLNSDANYCKTSGIIHTKSQNLNVSILVLRLPLRNPLKAGVTSRMKM